MITRASAPGKLFLFGEYAVLCGGWSLVAATDRQVMVERDPSRTGYQVVGAPLSADTRLPRAAMRAIGEPEERVEELRADLSDLYVEGEKLGLGSSAASTIAAMLAVKPSLGKTPALLCERAFAAHREIQDGKGSGADVASAAFGGLIAYRLRAPQEPFTMLEHIDVPEHVVVLEQEHALIVEALSLPHSLRIEAVWTGAPASSTLLISALESALLAHPHVVHEALTVMGESASLVIGVLTDLEMKDEERCEHIVHHARRVNEAMARLTHDAGVAILTPRHQALCAAMQGLELGVKVSGAGGGDFSLLMGHHDADWHAALSSLPEGCLHIPLVLGAPRLNSAS